MTTTDTIRNWAETINTSELHEPTVRAIIDTMKRSGAGFAARVLEAQFRNDQIEESDDAAYRRFRQLADFIESHPNFGITVEGCGAWWPITIHCNDASELHEKRRAIGGKWTKDASSSYFTMIGLLGDNHVKLMVPRDQVCERVVTGTEIKMVPDPDAPLVENEVEIVEWICPDALLGDTE